MCVCVCVCKDGWMDGWMHGWMRFFTQRGDNSLFPESKNCVCLNAG